MPVGDVQGDFSGARSSGGKKFESKRDPSSQKALLWMTAKYGLID